MCKLEILKLRSRNISGVHPIVYDFWTIPPIPPPLQQSFSRKLPISRYTCISISGELRVGSEPGVGIYMGIPVSLLAENLG